MEKNLESTILESLRRQCDGRGKTGQVAKQIGLSRPYLNKLVNGKCPVSGLTIETVQRMFPHATFNLNGDGVNAANSGTVHGVVGMNSGTVNTSAPAVASESFRLRVLEAVIGLDIPADALQIVLKTIKEIKP